MTDNNGAMAFCLALYTALIIFSTIIIMVFYYIKKSKIEENIDPNPDTTYGQNLIKIYSFFIDRQKLKYIQILVINVFAVFILSMLLADAKFKIGYILAGVLAIIMGVILPIITRKVIETRNPLPEINEKQAEIVARMVEVKSQMISRRINGYSSIDPELRKQYREDKQSLRGLTTNQDIFKQL